MHIDLLQFFVFPWISMVTVPRSLLKHCLATYSSIVLPGLSLVCLRSHTFICPPNVTAATSCVFVNVILFMVVLSADSNKKYRIIIFLSYENMQIIMTKAGWRIIIWKEIMAVIDTTFAVAERKPEKIQASTGFEPLNSAIPGAALYQLS